MSQRERWIIYPLLFFAIAMIIREDFFVRLETKGRVRTKIVECEQVTVTDSQGNPAVQVGSRGGSGFVRIRARRQDGDLGTAKPVAVELVVTPKLEGAVITRGVLGAPLVELIGDEVGGTVRVYDETGKPRGVIALVSARRAERQGESQEDSDGPEGGDGGEDPRTAVPRPPMPPHEHGSRQE